MVAIISPPDVLVDQDGDDDDNDGIFLTKNHQQCQRPPMFLRSHNWRSAELP